MQIRGPKGPLPAMPLLLVASLLLVAMPLLLVQYVSSLFRPFLGSSCGRASSSLPTSRTKAKVSFPKYLGTKSLARVRALLQGSYPRHLWAAEGASLKKRELS